MWFRGFTATYRPGKPAGCQDKAQGDTHWSALNTAEQLALTLWADEFFPPPFPGHRTQPAPLGRALNKDKKKRSFVNRIPLPAGTGNSAAPSHEGEKNRKEIRMIDNVDPKPGGKERSERGADGFEKREVAGSQKHSVKGGTPEGPGKG